MSWMDLGSPNGAIRSVIANSRFFYASDQSTNSLFDCVYDTAANLDWRWQQVGGPGATFATGSDGAANIVVGLTPQRTAVNYLVASAWQALGGPAHDIFTDGRTVYA